MRVRYDKTPYPTVHRQTGVKLIPGEFEIENEKRAKKLIEIGLVSAVSPPAPTEGEPEPETEDTVSEVEDQREEETDFDDDNQEEEA